MPISHLPYILKLIILVVDPIGSHLLLLAPKGLYRWILIHFYFRLISRKTSICFGRSSGMKKAALEKLSQKCEIFFFSLKSIKWAGRWGRLYEDFVEINYAKKPYTATPKYQKNHKFLRLD